MRHLFLIDPPERLSPRADTSIAFMREGDSGELWFGSRGGLTHVDASGRMRCLRTRDGLPADDVTHVVPDARGGGENLPGR